MDLEAAGLCPWSECVGETVEKTEDLDHCKRSVFGHNGLRPRDYKTRQANHPPATTLYSLILTDGKP